MTDFDAPFTFPGLSHPHISPPPLYPYCHNVLAWWRMHRAGSDATTVAQTHRSTQRVRNQSLDEKDPHWFSPGDKNPYKHHTRHGRRYLVLGCSVITEQLLNNVLCGEGGSLLGWEITDPTMRAGRCKKKMKCVSGAAERERERGVQQIITQQTHATKKRYRNRGRGIAVAVVNRRGERCGSATPAFPCASLATIGPASPCVPFPHFIA